EESFDPIPRTLEDCEDDGNGKEDQGMESIFTTGSSIVTPIPSHKSTMTPSIITTTITTSQSPIPPTPVPSDIFLTLPTFASVFCFEDRVKSLEVNFSNILGIVHQYMHQQMPEAVREAVQIQTDRLQDFIQRENDEFLRTIDDNMKKIIKETLNDVRNALDDRLKGIRMQYLPTTIWRKGDKDRAAVMIQAIDKMLKTRKIMRSLE
nr:hypothetical protein [Tanacetum cinerariifolium]